MFRTWGALKSHLIGSAHRCLTVVCPWCPGKEKTFTRISDIESHVRGSAHAGEAWKSKEMFSRQAGFYFAVNPIDYAKVTEAVTPYNSDLAYYIRMEFRNWADGFDDNKDRVDRLNKGWKEGEEWSKKKERRGRSVSSERPGKNTDKQTKQSNSSERRKRQTESVLDSDKSKKQKTLENRKSNKEEKTLDNNTNKKQHALRTEVMEQETLQNDTNKERRRLETGQANRTKDSLDEGKLKHVISEKGDANKEQKTKEDGDFYESEYDCHVDEERPEQEAAVQKILEVMGEPRVVSAGGSEQDLNSEFVATKVPGIGVVSMRLNDKTGGFLPVLDSNDVERELNCVTVGDLKCTSVTGGEIGTNARKDDKGSEEVGDEQNTGHSRIIKDIREVKVGNASNDIDGSSSTTDSSSSSSDTSSVTSLSPSRSTLRNRAIKLLTMGVMPLCPPARRIWTREIHVDILDIEMKWPPKNWQELTPENRLFAMEQMALFLERKNNIEFSTISKKVICDKYAFLLLEGQDKPIVGNSEAEKIPDKIRQYNASYLRGIIKGDIPDSQIAWSIIKSLEKADRWTDTDDIIKVLEEGGVKIKI